MHHPKHLGGIGLVEFVHDVDARTMSNIVHAICSEDEALSGLSRAFLEWAVSTLNLGGICALLLGSVFKTAAGKTSQDTYTKRCIHLLRLFHL